MDIWWKENDVKSNAEREASVAVGPCMKSKTSRVLYVIGEGTAQAGSQ